MEQDGHMTSVGGKSLHYRQFNGFNCLLRDQIGFWTDLLRKKMPASNFLLHTDEFEVQELSRVSILPYFTTDLVAPQNLFPPSRSALLTIDPEADVAYH